MFFQGMRQRLRERQQWAVCSVRQHRDPIVLSWRRRLDEARARVRRAFGLFFKAAVMVLGCCIATFIVGAYSAGRQYYKAVTDATASSLPLRAKPSGQAGSTSQSPQKAVVAILPDPLKTPGETDVGMTIDVLRVRETFQYRRLSTATIECAWDAYRIPQSDRWRYRLDHLIPIQLGGTSDSCKNVWPEPIAESARKDRLETVLNKLVRDGRLTLEEAQREISTNWIAAYARHVVPLDETASRLRHVAIEVADSPLHPLSRPFSPSVGITCSDGSTSHSASHRGACSHHGGIR